MTEAQATSDNIGREVLGPHLKTCKRGTCSCLGRVLEAILRMMTMHTEQLGVWHEVNNT